MGDAADCDAFVWPGTSYADDDDVKPPDPGYVRVSLPPSAAHALRRFDGGGAGLVPLRQASSSAERVVACALSRVASLSSSFVDNDEQPPPATAEDFQPAGSEHSTRDVGRDASRIASGDASSSRSSTTSSRGGAVAGSDGGFSFPTTPPCAAVTSAAASRDVFSSWSGGGGRGSGSIRDYGLSASPVLRSGSGSAGGSDVSNLHAWPRHADAGAVGDGYLLSSAANEGNQQFDVFHLRVVHRRGMTGFEDSRELRLERGELVAGRYQVAGFLGAAAFSQAFQARDLAADGRPVCLKVVRPGKDYLDQGLDEVKLLRLVAAADPGGERPVVRLLDFFYHREHLFIVTELLRANLYELQRHTAARGAPSFFTPSRLRRVAAQVLDALVFLHGPPLGLIHCDLKPENVLIARYADPCAVKVIDLGSSCFASDRLGAYVQSRSYRAPEVLLGLPAYGPKIDVWSLGCVLAELAAGGRVLFQNESVATLLARLEGVLGPLPERLLAEGRHTGRYYAMTPDGVRVLYEPRQDSEGAIDLLLLRRSSLQERVPGVSDEMLSFLAALLQPDPDQRPSAEEALRHPWLAELDLDCA